MAIRAKILDLFAGNPDYRKPLSEPIKMVDFMRTQGFVLELQLDLMNIRGLTAIGTTVDGVDCPVMTFYPPELRSGGFQHPTYFYKVSVPPYDPYFAAGTHTVVVRTGKPTMMGAFPFWKRKYVWEDEKAYQYTITGTKEDT